MFKIKHFIQQSWLLIVASFCFGLLIAIANAAWSPRIEQNKKAKLDKLMNGLIDGAGSFEVVAEDIKIKVKKGKSEKTNIYKGVGANGECAGFAFIAVGPGFADKIELVIAVDDKCQKFLGYDVLASNETPGFGAKIKESFYRDQFKNAPTVLLNVIKVGDSGMVDDEIVAISGATVSSEAVVDIFNKYVGQIKEKLQTRGFITGDK